MKSCYLHESVIFIRRETAIANTGQKEVRPVPLSDGPACCTHASYQRDESGRELSFLATLYDSWINEEQSTKTTDKEPDSHVV